MKRIFILCLYIILLIPSCRDEVDPLADISQFSSSAVIEPTFMFLGNLSLFNSQKSFNEIGVTQVTLLRYEGDLEYNISGNHFTAKLREQLHFNLPILEINCFDLNQLTHLSEENAVSPPVFSQLLFDQTGERYTLLNEDFTVNQVCIDRILSDGKIIEGTFNVSFVHDTTGSLGEEKIYAPWLPDTIRMVNGEFTARVAIDF